jgi:hypothetical protein
MDYKEEKEETDRPDGRLLIQSRRDMTLSVD